MRNNSLARSLEGLKSTAAGENYGVILSYFYPEFITALVLYSLVSLIDARFIAHLKSTSLYATFGVTSTLIHFITKVAEGLSVGTVILCGQYNGLGRYADVGKAAVGAFWVTVLCGIIVAASLFFGAEAIYIWYGVPDKLIQYGKPFLQLKAISIFFMFIFFGLVGFLRGIKNTKATMYFFVLGSAVFLTVDYLLIFGKYGFPEYGFIGSAYASIIQYVVMVAGALTYILWDTHYRIYRIQLFKIRHITVMRDIFSLSWPVVIDKATLAAAKMWLCKMINPMGKYAIGSFGVIKDMEMLAFVPAIALAQVVTFLVSNDYGRGNWLGIKNNIKKIIFLAVIMVALMLCLLLLYAEDFIHLFDQKRAFISFALGAFPFISILVFFDVLQLILAGALRGAADVRTVMWVRLISFLIFFVPLSYCAQHLPIENTLIKFVFIYGSFYIGNGLMSMVYINRFRGDLWKYRSNITL